MEILFFVQEPLESFLREKVGTAIAQQTHLNMKLREAQVLIGFPQRPQNLVPLA